MDKTRKQMNQPLFLQDVIILSFICLSTTDSVTFIPHQQLCLASKKKSLPLESSSTWDSQGGRNGLQVWWSITLSALRVAKAPGRSPQPSSNPVYLSQFSIKIPSLSLCSTSWGALVHRHHCWFVHYTRRPVRKGIMFRLCGCLLIFSTSRVPSTRVGDSINDSSMNNLTCYKINMRNNLSPFLTARHENNKLIIFTASRATHCCLLLEKEL